MIEGNTSVLEPLVLECKVLLDDLGQLDRKLKLG
jgi:hypothetical protein